MGLTLLMRLVQVLDYCDKNVNNNCNNVNVRSNITTYIDFVYDQEIGFSTHLLYPERESKYNGLYAHGYNYATGDHSCCPWGRANAWIMTSHIEILRMFKNLNDTKYDKQEQEIIKLYQNQVNEMASLMDEKTGRWHQVINVTSTYLETSASTGFLNGILFGRIRDILPTNVYSLDDWDRIIDSAWNGLLDVVDMNTGIISGQCRGTGIENDVEGYEERSTEYCLSGDPGDPSFVINAIVSYQEYLNMIHHHLNTMHEFASIP